MAWTPITGDVSQYHTQNNVLASGYYLKFYVSGTLTPLSVATDSSGSTTLAKVKLNDRGMPISSPLDNNTIIIPHVDQAYRIVLYKSETDADNDDTANAEFNVDGIAPDIAPSAQSSDIALRRNTLQIQDDYDRSPLFVDGNGFTAGAGPHVITVPTRTPVLDPTSSEFRIWRLDGSTGVVEPLTATSVTSTTFTLAETLLSTDVIFVGDQEFRNQMDGDPSDIRARLNTFDIAQNLQEIEDAGASAQEEACENINTVNLGDLNSARSDLGVGEYTESLNIDATGSGNFTSGTFSVVRVGNMVTLSGSFFHASSASPSSDAGLVPSGFRPTLVSGFNCYRALGTSFIGNVQIETDGTISLFYLNFSGASSPQTGSSSVNVSYISTS